MIDLASISLATSSVKSAIEIAKLIKDSSSSLEEAELKLKFADLIGTLADAKMQIAEIQDLLISSEEENKKLQRQLLLEKKMDYEAPYYWKNLDDGSKDGPYCQKCFDEHQKIIRLQDKKNGTWHCLSCSSTVKDNSYVKPSPRKIRTRYQAF